jgi:hypothetical protein
LSLRRNARLKPKSTLQSAIGIRHPRITQRAMGFMGGAFNTREFFHGRAPGTLRHVKAGFLVAPSCCRCCRCWPWVWPAVPRPGWRWPLPVQYAGLLAERWFFFAQANHPQNLYYQAVS